jgi:uncharacterized lipoprotein YddW (UPF0748 family)
MVRQGLMRYARSVGASLLAIMLSTSCSIMETTPTLPSSLRICALGASTPDCPPASPREFRAVWVATVANIDWPTKPGLPDAQQQAEVIAILNRVQALNMNAVLLQVRPAADAIYPSQLEPWAEWLAGEQGKAPGYDPLAFWIAEAKKRGIEVHAWFNPYRARHTKAVSPISKDHIANRAPNAVKSYGGFLWLDPGERAAQDHSYNVIMDVLRRYDIDGVHFDDYFYPYPVVETPAAQQPTTPQNAVSNALNQATPQAPAVVTTRPEREVDFPDEPSWQAYVASGGKLSRADWRRDNVNRFVERVYKGVKAEKPWVRFGISPFGIGRPDRRPPGIVGFSQYDKLYADVELWLQRGWLDYLAPQLYWSIDQAPQAFGTLLDYWHAQNTAKRDIFPGLYTSRIEETPRGWQPKEIENQIGLIRAKQGVAQGHIHFSMIAIAQNRRKVQSALNARYSQSALNIIAPEKRAIAFEMSNFEIEVNATSSLGYQDIRVLSSSQNQSTVLNGVALHLRYGNRWQFAFLPLANVSNSANAGTHVLAETTVPSSTQDGALNAVAASLVDRYARESVRLVREVAP